MSETIKGVYLVCEEPITFGQPVPRGITSAGLTWARYGACWHCGRTTCIEVEAPNRLPDTPFRMRLGGELVEASLAWRNCARAGVKFDPQRTEGAADSPVSRGTERKPLSNGAVAGR